jgi:DNA transposition AAA+ family ATPase
VKQEFVKTANFEKLVKAIRRAEQRGAKEAGMVFVQAHPGTGKSKAVENYAINDAGAVFIRAKQGYTVFAFLRELARELSIDTGCRPDELFRRCLSALAHRPGAKIIVDEVQHCLINSAAVLEKIRDFSDMTGIVVVLVAGEEGVWERLGRRPQLASRVCEAINFDRASERDVAGVCAQLSEVEIKADLVKRIHADSKGLMRLVLNAIANVELIARNNGLTAVAAKDCDGFSLCVNWTDRKVAFDKA